MPQAKKKLAIHRSALIALSATLSRAFIGAK
jgi:hypothetical protein